VNSFSNDKKQVIYSNNAAGLQLQCVFVY